MMKKFVLKFVYLAAVFFITLLVVSGVANQGNADMTVEMAPASFPMVHMVIGGREINGLYGHGQPMECSFQRGSITSLGADRKVGIVIDKYGQRVTGLSFEVRSIDGERLVESTPIISYQETEERIAAEFTVKDLIEAGTEYMLVLLLDNERGETIRYYTRIIQAEDYYLQEKLDYVLDFHSRTFDKEGARELTKYLESNAEGDNTTFGRVTIHSSFQQVTWGELAVSKLTEPEVTIKELAAQTGSLELSYMVKLDEGDRSSLYNIKELYRVRYTADRIYLLDFERIMKQIFDEREEVAANNKIALGITLEEDMELRESDGGNVLAFTDGNRLFSYNVNDQKLSRLFSFYNGDYEDKRECLQKHGIKILDVDEAGNIQFAVYGYMNRGRHEGQVGIAVYHFSGLANTVEEVAYIPSQSSYEILHAELEQLCYINKTNIFFFMQKGAVYAVNLESRSCEAMVSGLKEESYRVSDSNRMVVWQQGDDRYASEKLVLMNLNTRKRTEIAAEEGDYIAPLGFMGEDLIYGAAHAEDVVQDSTGSMLFPMYCVKIQNENGQVLKTYQEDGIYVTGSGIEDNQINLYRLQRLETSGGYTEIENDQIVSTKTEDRSSNRLEAVAIDKYGKIIQIAVKSNIDTRALKLLVPKEVLFEGEREITLTEEEEESPRYYVYGKNGVEGIFTDEGNAVSLANKLAGEVISERGGFVWRKGNLRQKNQIMAIKGTAVTEEKNSLAVCLDTILQYEGIMRNTEYMLDRGEMPLHILEEHLEGVRVLDLSGCSLDAMLYYLNQDIPVLVSLNDGNALLLIGFNEVNTVVMNPQTGTIYKMGMNDSAQMFQENGNRFVTYMREDSFL